MWRTAWPPPATERTSGVSLFGIQSANVLKSILAGPVANIQRHSESVPRARWGARQLLMNVHVERIGHCNVSAAATKRTKTRHAGRHHNVYSTQRVKYLIGKWQRRLTRRCCLLWLCHRCAVEIRTELGLPGGFRVAFYHLLGHFRDICVVHSHRLVKNLVLKHSTLIRTSNLN